MSSPSLTADRNLFARRISKLHAEVQSLKDESATLKLECAIKEHHRLAVEWQQCAEHADTINETLKEFESQSFIEINLHHIGRTIENRKNTFDIRNTASPFLRLATIFDKFLKSFGIPNIAKPIVELTIFSYHHLAKRLNFPIFIFKNLLSYGNLFSQRIRREIRKFLDSDELNSDLDPRRPASIPRRPLEALEPSRAPERLFRLQPEPNEFQKILIAIYGIVWMVIIVLIFLLIVVNWKHPINTLAVT